MRGNQRLPAAGSNRREDGAPLISSVARASAVCSPSQPLHARPPDHGCHARVWVLHAACAARVAPDDDIHLMAPAVMRPAVRTGPRSSDAASSLAPAANRGDGPVDFADPDDDKVRTRRVADLHT